MDKYEFESMELEQIAECVRDGSFSGEGTVGPFDSARGLFSEGSPIYDNAGFKEKTHVQICVRNPNCVKGYFIPLEEDTGWPMP